MKYKRLILGLGAILAIFAGSIAAPVQVMATDNNKVDCTVEANKNKAECQTGDNGCGVLKFHNVSCNTADNDGAGEMNIANLLIAILRILNVGVGIAAVGTLIYAGILYSTASGDANKTAKAKTIITNVVIGVLAYAVMSIALNFLVPGGIIK